MADITITGLGPAGLDLLAGANLRLLEEAPRLILRTGRHPAAEELRARGVSFTALDPLYEKAASFEGLYPGLAEAVLKAAGDGPVVYAVPGHPLFGEESVRLLLLAAAESGLSTRVVAAPAFTGAVAAALASAGVRDDLTEWQVADGAALDRVWWDPTRPTLIFQVDDVSTASRVKLGLMEEYPEQSEVWIVRHAGDAESESVTRLPLYRLDRPDGPGFDHLTTVYLPPSPSFQGSGFRVRSSPPPNHPITQSPNHPARPPTFRDFVDVIAMLRSPDGCPWDREQTYQSLKRFVLEEAYEVLEAVDAGDGDRLCDELGDLMLQVLLYSQIAREEGAFDIRDVIARHVEKLVRRHPHVFGDVSVRDAEEVKRNWDAIKQQEKPERTSALDGVPKELPALMKALEVSKRAVKVGFEWPSLESVVEKLDEEVAELKAELPERDPEKLCGELGDLLFTVVNVARWLKIDPEEALRRMLRRFETRFREMERLAGEEGRPVQGRPIEDLDRLWEEAKRITTERN